MRNFVLFILGMLTCATFAQSGKSFELALVNSQADATMYSACEGEDSTMYFVGNIGTQAHVSKVDIHGNHIWSKNYNLGVLNNFFFDVAQLSDGNFMACGRGGSYNSFLTKFDENGDVIWSSDFGLDDNEQLVSIIATSDNGAIATGFTRSFGDDNDILVTRVDENGSKVWSKRFDGGNFEQGQDLLIYNGFLYLTAYVGLGSDAEGILIKMDLDGSLIYMNRYYSDAVTDIASRLSVAPNGNINIGLKTTQSTNGGEDILLLEVDTLDGAIIWAKSIGSAGDEGANSFTTIDDKILIHGKTTGFGNNYEQFLCVVDENGNVEATYEFGGGANDDKTSGPSIIFDQFGGVTLAGFSESFDGGASKNFHIMRIAADYTNSCFGVDQTFSSLDITNKMSFANYPVTEANTVFTWTTPTVTYIDQSYTFSMSCDESLEPVEPDSVFSVWPGDCNDDGIANVLDIMPIGFNYGDNGPVRQNASLVWEAQEASVWGNDNVFNTDKAHADANGDGTIDIGDVLGILTNYSSTHNRSLPEERSGLPKLSLTMTKDRYFAGEEVNLIVNLEGADLEVDEFYGLAVFLNYDTNYIADSSITADFNYSWAGTHNSDLISVEKQRGESGHFDVGVVRNDKLNKAGYGEVFRIVSIIDEDVVAGLDDYHTIEPARSIQDDSITLSFSVAYAELYAYDTDGDSTKIEFEYEDTVEVKIYNSIEEIASRDYYLKAFPNPTNASITVDFTGEEVELIEVFNVVGEIVSTIKVQKGTNSMKVDLSNFGNGTYFVKASYESGDFKRLPVILLD